MLLRRINPGLVDGTPLAFSANLQKCITSSDTTMQAGDNKSYDDINVTPMVDLYLVLLLIFIIMTTAGVQSVKVNLPKAGGPTKKTEGPKTQAITINSEGKVFLNTAPVSLAALEEKLTQLKAKTPE